MRRPRFILTGLLICSLLGAPLETHAQEARPYRVGVVLYGGPYSQAVDGLRDGLRELGFDEGKQFLLHVRDAKGDLKSVEAAAKALESEKVDLIYALSTSVTLAVKRATRSTVIVFYAGTDPVGAGLVQSLRQPEGRLTGIHGRFTDLTAKRFQLLKEMVPGLRRVVTFYSPGNPAAQESIKIARDGARQLKVMLIEKPIGSVEELGAGLRALRPGEADAFLYVADAMVTSQSQLVIDIARDKKLPVMFADRDSTARGALASYGVSYYAVGRLSATRVHRVLLGTAPRDLPVEQIDRLHFAINLKTAKALGLTIPPSVMIRADEVIE